MDFQFIEAYRPPMSAPQIDVGARLPAKKAPRSLSIARYRLSRASALL